MRACLRVGFCESEALKIRGLSMTCMATSQNRRGETFVSLLFDEEKVESSLKMMQGVQSEKSEKG
jgi:hypothetical protein